eukprot:7984883-Karenia_brevis.AAC.1
MRMKMIKNHDENYYITIIIIIIVVVVIVVITITITITITFIIISILEICDVQKQRGACSASPKLAFGENSAYWNLRPLHMYVRAPNVCTLHA